MDHLPLLGGCLCGRVRYAVENAPLYVYYCHCRMCRKASGCVAAAWMTVRAADFRWAACAIGDYAYARAPGEPGVPDEPDHAGESPSCLRSYESTPGKFQRQFCGECGSHVLFKRRGPSELGGGDELDELEPGFLEIAHGSLDPEFSEVLSTRNHIWLESKLSWLKLDEHLEGWAREPGGEGSPSRPGGEVGSFSSEKK